MATAGPVIDRIENGPFFVNTYVVGCPSTKSGILVDPGHETDRIQAAIDASGLSIEAIVNTHGHIDHIASVAWFRKSLGVPFRLHRGDAVFVERIAESAASFGLDPIERPDVDAWLEPGTSFEVGELTVEFRHAPGHSPGSLILDLGAAMLVGDVVFRDSIGRTDLPFGDLPTLLASIRREVLSRDDDVTLYPGHGPTTTVGAERRANPFLQPA